MPNHPLKMSRTNLAEDFVGFQWNIFFLKSRRVFFEISKKNSLPKVSRERCSDFIEKSSSALHTTSTRLEVQSSWEMDNFETLKNFTTDVRRKKYLDSRSFFKNSTE